MITKTEFYNLLFKFIKIKVCYSQNFKTYLVNDLYTNEIDAVYFEEKAKEIESNLLYVLKISTDKKEFLNDLLEIIWQEIDYYKKNEIQFFSYIKHYIKNLKGTCEIDREPNSDKFTIDGVKNFNYDTEDNDKLLYHLKSYQEEANNYDDLADFELAKLLYVIQLHFDTLNELYSSIYEIEMEIDTLDLDALISFNSKILYENKNPKCNVNLDKISTANLFHVLMTAGYFSFDINDEKNNKKQMFNFIENNFTYRTEGGEKHLITKIYKEFLYIGSRRHTERQISIISNLISILTTELDIIKENDLKSNLKKSLENP